MATYPVKYYRSQMRNAPQLNASFGELTTLLDAILVDGFDQVTLASLTRASSVATATVAAGHQYQIGQILLVAGAGQADYNGECKVTGITSTTFTFDVANSPVTPATGTITCKVAPLGFERQFTGTNKRVFRSASPLSSKPCLRVDNAQDAVWTAGYAKYAKVTIASGFSDIDTVVGAQAPYDFLNPTKNTVGTGTGTTAVGGWMKWYYSVFQYNAAAAYSESSGSPAGNKSWIIVGDDRGFYFFVEGQQYNYGKTGYAFGEFESYKTADANTGMLIGSEWYSAANTQLWNGAATPSPELGQFFARSGDSTGKWLLRDYHGQGGPLRFNHASVSGINGQFISGYSTGVPALNPADSALILNPVYLRQENLHMRGKQAGLYFICNDMINTSPFQDSMTLSNVTGYPGKEFLLVGLGLTNAGWQASKVALDITGPWR